MNNTIQPANGFRTHSVHPKSRDAKQFGTQAGSFLDMITQASGSTSDTLKLSSSAEITKTTEASNTDAYMEHLKNKYGRITIESIKKDQASLEKAGGRMSGHDVVIAPNILNEMASDAKKAVYYEQKIDDFFDAIPRLQTQFAAKGLNYEPCGVVIHEDGAVTYISGCGDSPERVAEVNAMNNARDAKRAAQRKEYQEQAMTAAEQNKAMWERIEEAKIQSPLFFNIGDFVKSQTAAATSLIPEMYLSEGTNMFFLNL